MDGWVEDAEWPSPFGSEGDPQDIAESAETPSCSHSKDCLEVIRG